jgi:hypothetical protein
MSPQVVERLFSLNVVPAISGRALRAFRIALAIALVFVVWAVEILPTPLESQRHYAGVDLEFVHALAASDTGLVGVRLVATLAAVLFGIGVMARHAYATFVLAFFLLVLVALEYRGTHDLGLPFVTLVGWLTVPWDASILPGSKADSISERASRRYGFALWWPGLTMGVAFLAAAIAKLQTSGLEWISGGAVRYHFVTDAHLAPLTWGLWVASHEAAAVTFAFGAIVLEAGFILVAFTARPALRLLGFAGGAAVFVSI